MDPSHIGTTRAAGDDVWRHAQGAHGCMRHASGGDCSYAMYQWPWRNHQTRHSISGTLRGLVNRIDLSWLASVIKQRRQQLFLATVLRGYLSQAVNKMCVSSWRHRRRLGAGGSSLAS